MLKLYLASPRATELLPGLVEKDMNWIDVEVVGINDMTFTRYETISKMSSSYDEKTISKMICEMICQDGIRASIICSGTCGCWILQSNGELLLIILVMTVMMQKAIMTMVMMMMRLVMMMIMRKFQVEEGDTLYVDYEGTLEVTLISLKFQQTLNLFTMDSLMF